MIDQISSAVVVAPHPDDETLGCGGTISRLITSGVKVSILVVSGHLPPLYPKESFNKTYNEAKSAFSIMGVKDYKFLEIPATYVHSMPISKLNSSINQFIKLSEPELLLIPFPDRHIDHRVIFDSCVVAARPVGKSFPKLVLAYETLSETHWNVPGIEPSFNPEFFVDISNHIDNKVSALNAYKSQILNSPSRSIDACLSLAKFRGSQNGCKHAEAFKVIRIIA